MKIAAIESHAFKMPFLNGKVREGMILSLDNSKYQGEASPLPGFSKESLHDVLSIFERIKGKLLEIDWQMETLEEELKQLALPPSLEFGLETALVNRLSPLPASVAIASALLMGTPDEIMTQAQAREKEGYHSAKIKVGHLSEKSAKELLMHLKDRFTLRVDVNRAWDVEKSLHFFSAFDRDAFDYIEEPFQDPTHLEYFTHPFAVDESYPALVNLTDLESIPTFKALIFKPTIQGGYLRAAPLAQWAEKRNKQLILSAAFEGPIGIEGIKNLAIRLKNPFPIGIGTIHHFKQGVFHAA